MAKITNIPKELKKREASIPKELKKDEKAHFKELVKEFSELGIDTYRFKRGLITLAKDYALEARLEKDLEELGGSVAYEAVGGPIPFKEHPSAKHLETVRARIMSSLKAFGLLPTAKAVKTSTESKISPFAAIGK